MASTVLPWVTVSKVTCSRNDNFKSLRNGALNKIRFQTSRNGIGFTAQPGAEVVQLNLFLPEKEMIDSNDIENILINLENYVLIIFDEFDSVTDAATRRRMADTIKSLSDNVQFVTILLVGIADNVIDLIGEHPSLERCLMQIRMPRMSDSELEEIIEKGLTALELSITDDVKRKIIEYSSGFPHYTHALCKNAAYQAILEESSEVNIFHFTYAVKKSIESTSQSLHNSYQKASIYSKGVSNFPDVMSACALCKMDDYNCFSSNDMLDVFKVGRKADLKTTDVRYYLEALCSESKGGILEKVGRGSNIRYKFSNPMMRAFIRLKVYDKKAEKKST